MKVLKVEKKEH